jgi:hypothetical protein
MRVSGSLLRLNDFAPGVLVVTIALLGPSGAWGASVKECQDYSRITMSQVDIAKGKNNGGIGDGCPRAKGPRWSNDKAEHFNWCQEATPEDLAGELKARHNLLLDCTTKRGRQKWYGWDDKSLFTYSGGHGYYSPDESGKGKCDDQGKIILNAVRAVQKDRSILFDEAKDKHFYNSNYYHHFQHWQDYRCVLGKTAANTRAYFLEGYTGVGVATKPREGPIVAPGPIEGTELEKGPIAATPDESAPPPDQPEQPYVTKRKTGPFTQD